MRPILLALALVTVPAAARAELALRLELFDGAARPVHRARLDLPLLTVGGLPALALDEGGGAGARHRRVEPAIALILGIIPGFGIGHLVAGSDEWPIWLIVDIVIFVVWPGGFFLTGDRAYSFLGLLVLVERVFEGMSAYHAAGGGPVFRSERGFAARVLAPAELALPVGARAAAMPWAALALPPGFP